MKKRVGILFGGKSAEHEVSLQSAKNIYEAIDRALFEPVLVGIDKSGRWHLSDASRFLLNQDDPGKISLNTAGGPVALQPETRGLLSANDASAKAFAELPLDVVFPILHGPFGEDGTIQGFLKLADLPFVGPGVLGSAVGMDKDAMKRLLRDAGLPIGKFAVLKSHERVPPFLEMKNALGCPFFIKPANMGSSVGISKVHGEDEYGAAVKDAFQYDVKIIIEEFIPGREIECAVLGNENPAASAPGEVIPTHEFYSYDAKYLDENGAALEIPAKISEETRKRIQELAVKTFQTLCCEGLSRVDFFLKENGEIFVNEINTMPGFTRISMYPKLWEASGISYTELITRLIELAVRRYEKERGLKTSRTE
ncbi:MAG: D-alanine--D-alanine ligase [Treponema sp.]|jgi:D-alanine-D-alanine ligase|nr:D-alanine--D-alanine ligase [Treponema sp.]